MKRKCAGCKQEKLTDHFTRNKKSPDGIAAQCRKCLKEKKLPRAIVGLVTL